MNKERHETKLIEDNPFVDVAAYLFLEDIADKQGPAGMNNYLISLATSLARSMPEEEYKSWEEFKDALANNRSILTTFEDVFLPTDNCVVTTKCPFGRGWAEYTKRIGNFAKIHTDVAEYYNTTIKPSVVDTQCIIHQTYRSAAAERIRVGGKRVKYAQIAAVSEYGVRKIVPEEWLPILLATAKISRTELNMLLRNNSCVWLLYTE